MYWTWWQGALGIAVTAVGFSVAYRKNLGVSGALARVLSGPDPSSGALEMSDADLQAALAAATVEQFGALPSAVPTSAPAIIERPAPPLEWSVYASFLAALVVGGALVQFSRSGLGITTELPALFQQVWGAGAAGFAWLVAGGVLVGFGTRMAGGCTSGHGISGCSRLRPSSFVATGCFLGIAVAFTLLLEALR